MSDLMSFHRTVTVVNENGMHMTPCSVLVRLTNDFSGNVRLSNGDREANCKSIFDLMLLAATHGTILSLTVSGEQAEMMMEQIVSFFENGFHLDS